MKAFEVIVRCSREPQKHAKKLRVTGEGENGRNIADTLAGLLDGSSKFYIHKPGPNSPIGKCATCQAPVECTVEEVEIKNAEP